MKINFVDYPQTEEAEDILEVIYLNKLTPKRFLKDMKKYGVIKEISGDYATDCCSLCRNATAWLLQDLKYFPGVKVVEGRVDGYPHTWLKVGDYYLDYTLAQFKESKPVVISHVKRNKIYSKACEFEIKEWAELEGDSFVKTVFLDELKEGFAHDKN